MFEFKHPKYYTELRKRNKAARIPPTSSGQAASDQVISHSASTEANSRRAPGPGLKQQAASDKPQADDKPQAKPEPSSGS